jgi:glyoxylase-like metal-dependent hydrolase (beta-lactamase superfamily II)
MAAAPPPMQIAPGLHSIGQKQGGHVHAYLAESDGGELTLIDTMWEGDGRNVFEAIRRLGRKPSDVKRIALTHGHRSHLGGAKALREQTRAKTYAHPAEAGIVEGTQKAKRVPILRPIPTSLIKFRLGLALGVPKHPPCPVDEPLADGDSFGPFQVVHAPGHSPGHTAFWWEERRALISGDAIATWPSVDAGWPDFQLDSAEHERSLRRMASLEPLVVGVGHGEPLSEGTPDRVHALAERARFV